MVVTDDPNINLQENFENKLSLFSTSENKSENLHNQLPPQGNKDSILCRTSNKLNWKEGKWNYTNHFKIKNQTGDISKYQPPISPADLYDRVPHIPRSKHINSRPITARTIRPKSAPTFNPESFTRPQSRPVTARPKLGCNSKDKKMSYKKIPTTENDKMLISQSYPTSYLSLTRENSFVVIPNIEISEKWTIDFFLRNLQMDSDTKMIIEMGVENSVNKRFQLCIMEDRIRLLHNNIFILSSPKLLRLNDWTYISLIYDKKSVKLFENGYESDKGSLIIKNESYDYFYIGKSTSDDKALICDILGFRYFNREIEEEEMKKRMENWNEFHINQSYENYISNYQFISRLNG